MADATNAPPTAAVTTSDVTRTDVTIGHVLSAASLLGLRIDPAWNEGVLSNLKLLTDAAALVSAVPLDEIIEPAPVFTP